MATPDLSADAPAISDAERERLLSRLDPLKASIEEAEATLERLREERAGVYLEIRDAAPGIPLSKLAERAGVSVPAVIQQIEKATARRDGPQQEAI